MSDEKARMDEFFEVTSYDELPELEKPKSSDEVVEDDGDDEEIDEAEGMKAQFPFLTDDDLGDDPETTEGGDDPTINNPYAAVQPRDEGGRFSETGGPGSLTAVATGRASLLPNDRKEAGKVFQEQQEERGSPFGLGGDDPTPDEKGLTMGATDSILDWDLEQGLSSYSSENYAELNPALRSGAAIADDIEVGRIGADSADWMVDYISDIDEAMTHSRIEEPIRTYRVMDRSVIQELGADKVGARYQDDAFCSTAADKDGAYAFMDTSVDYMDDPVMMEVLVEPGVGAIDMAPFSEYPDEHEILLDRGLQFEVVESTGKKVVVRVADQDKSVGDDALDVLRTLGT